MVIETIKRLILRALRRKTPRPISPPPSVSAHPSPTPTGPHLESVGTSGGRCHLDLRPGGATIGRAPENDLVITQDLPGWETVSRRHARIYEQDDHWIVEDLNSTNGIYVNGRRTGRNLLREGWQLRVGGVEFLFRTSTGEERQ